jgi:hypothetical protein
MKWMITEDKLGSDQVEVIDEIGQINDRPIWIKGHAGSGKSVLLLHSLADYLIQKPSANVCVVVFTRSLVDLLETGLKQIPKLNGKIIPVLTIYQLKNRIYNGAVRYDAIFCDEVQDLPLEFIQSMKSVCNHLIIAGDAEQSIYNSVPIWNQPPASSKDIQDAILPIEKKLGIIYRLTESVLKILKQVFPAMLSDMPSLEKNDVDIKLFEAPNVSNEISFCWQQIKSDKINRPSEMNTILLWGRNVIIQFANSVLSIEGKTEWIRVNRNRDEPDFGLLNEHLKANNIPLMYVGNGYGSLVEAAKNNVTIIMTYHSSKGLDFDQVYLPLVGDGMYINSNIDSLLLVALSRSKSGLFISYTGSVYPGLKKFLSDIKSKKTDSKDSTEFIF